MRLYKIVEQIDSKDSKKSAMPSGEEFYKQHKNIDKFGNVSNRPPDNSAWVKDVRNKFKKDKDVKHLSYGMKAEKDGRSIRFMQTPYYFKDYQDPDEMFLAMKKKYNWALGK